MRRAFRHIAAILLLVVAWLGAAADGTGRLKNYDIWKDLPSEKLMEMGKRFYDTDKPDSSLVCYNIIVNRYRSDDKHNNTTPRQAGSALGNIGKLYMYYYNDVAKANRYLLEAQRIAKENHLLNLLSSIYTDLGNIKLMNLALSDINMDEEVLQLNRLAFHTALEANDNPQRIIISGINWISMLDDTTQYRRFHQDIDLFLQYQLPDSIKQYEFARIFARAIQEKGKKNYDACLQLLDSAYAHGYLDTRLSKQMLDELIINRKCHVLNDMDRLKELVELLYQQLHKAQDRDDNYHSYIYSNMLFQYYRNIAKDSVLGDKFELMNLRYKNELTKQTHLLDANKAEFLFQIDEINAEVQELNTRHRMMKIIAWGIAAVTLIILGLLYLLWRKYKQEQEKNRKLYENNLVWLAAEEERRQQIIEAEQNKYQSHQMEEGEQSDLLDRIFYVMETSDEVYQENFSLDRLTQLVDVKSPNYVSQVLNEHYDHTFKEMLNDYRIREACRRINDHDHYSQLTVQAIAESVGFGSYPNFVTNFKKFTGLTPSAYRKQSKDKSGPPAE
jgi:AraC-like DNA-binding protein